MKIFKKTLSFTICFVLVIGRLTLNVGAIENDEEIVYVDGIAFECYTNDNGELIISSLDDDGQTYLKVYSDGSAESQILDDGVLDEYYLEIEELSEEEVYVEVINEEGEIVEVYDSPEDLVVDEYDGQSALVIGVSITIGLLLEVLLQTLGTIVVGGLIYYAIAKVIDIIRKNGQQQKYYYKAHVDSLNHIVYIAFYSGTITLKQAISRLNSGNDVYTYFKSQAKQAVAGTGKNYIHNDYHYVKGAYQFDHYHVSKTNRAHALYGLGHYCV